MFEEFAATVEQAAKDLGFPKPVLPTLLRMVVDFLTVCYRSQLAAMPDYDFRSIPKPKCIYLRARATVPSGGTLDWILEFYAGLCSLTARLENTSACESEVILEAYPVGKDRYLVRIPFQPPPEEAIGTAAAAELMNATIESAITSMDEISPEDFAG